MRYVLPLLAVLAACANASADTAGRTAHNILGLDVFGPGDIRLGEVKDLLVASDGSIALIVFADHGAEPGDEAMAVPWAFAEVGERAVRIRGSKFMRLDFGGSAVAGWSVAAISGANVQVSDKLAWGRVADAVLDGSGHVTHLVVVAQTGGRYVVPLARLAVDREREEVTILADEPQVAEFQRPEPAPGP